MVNVGEQLVSSYLHYIRKCEFIQTNLYTVDTQGEIDVVGINLKEKKVYIAEVAIHLATGLQYTYEKRPNNVVKLTEKFSRDIEYTNKFFPDYDKHFMLWSPLVKGSTENQQYNQLSHVREIETNIDLKYGVKIDFVINEHFLNCLNEMRRFVRLTKSELKCPVMRLLQIEESLSRQVAKKAALKRKSQGMRELLTNLKVVAELNSVRTADVIQFLTSEQVDDDTPTIRSH